MYYHSALVYGYNDHQTMTLIIVLDGHSLINHFVLHLYEPPEADSVLVRAVGGAQQGSN